VRPIVLILLLPIFISGCTNLFFQPMKQHQPIPHGLGVELQDIYFDSDGLKLHAWFIPATQQARGTVFFLHGNAENISTHVRAVWWLARYGFNVFLFDYRGFGKSEGVADLTGAHHDISAALNVLFAMDNVDNNKIIMYGQSLGGSLAITALAASPQRKKIRALIVEGAFANYRQVAREALSAFWLTWAFQWPLSLTISDDYRPLDSIAHISPVPVLIVRGRDDDMIQAHHALDLFAAAKQPKQRWAVLHARHNNSFVSESAREELVEYMSSALESE